MVFFKELSHLGIINFQVSFRSVKRSVPQKRLYNSYVRATCQKMSRKRMPQNVRMNVTNACFLRPVGKVFPGRHASQ